MPLSRDEVYLLRMRYDPTTLLDLHHESRFESVATVWPTKPIGADWSSYKDTPDVSGLLSSSAGDLELYLLPGRFAYMRFERGNWVEDERSWQDKLAEIVAPAAASLLIRLLELRFGD
jgi:hypothetical protein